MDCKTLALKSCYFIKKGEDKTTFSVEGIKWVNSHDSHPQIAEIFMPIPCATSKFFACINSFHP